MTVILTTQEIGSQDVATAIAASLGLDLVPESQLAKLVADRMDIEQYRLRRLVAGHSPIIEHWIVRRRRLCAKYTTEVLAKLAARDNVVIQAWGTVGVQRPVQHMICVRVCGTAPFLAQSAKPPVSRKYIASVPTSWLRFFTDIRGSRAMPDLIFNTALMSVAECVEEVQRLVLSPHHQRCALSEVGSTDQMQEELGRADLTSYLRCSTGTRAMDVEVGCERLRISGVTSNEHAIAKIEERLHGMRDYTLARTPLLPPGVM
jgi:hypothetical protein